MTTDIAAIPLLWVVPLALYLLTFVVSFARRPILPHKWVLIAHPVLILPLALWFYWFYELSLSTLFGIHLLAFFVTALMCHGELSRTRPHTDYLTDFYLWISLGGVFGGAFNALLAPLIFNDIIEYRLAFIFACLLIPARQYWRQIAQRPWHLVNAGLHSVLIVGVLLLLMGEGNIQSTALAGLAGTIAIVLLVLKLSGHPVWYGLVLAVIFSAGAFYHQENNTILFQGRSYFGVHKAMRVGSYHKLYHGTTIHGIQHQDYDLELEPIAYYSREGPLGQMFDHLALRPKHRRVAIIGLGSGAIACYGRRNERWTFFEIDPLVKKIATNNHYFTYMQNCPPAKEIVIGDARLTLKRAPAHAFDIIILDAFTSDAIPIHLLTHEAIQLYLSKLRPGGVVIFHISNRHINLSPVLREIADKLGLAILAAYDYDTPQYYEEGMIFESKWMVMARKSTEFGNLANGPMWEVPKKVHGTRLWTDDYSDLFNTISWFQ